MDEALDGTSIHARVHRALTLDRRIRVLAEQLARLLPDHATVLDVGTGSGEIAREVARRRRGLTIDGIDTHVRPDPAIPVRQFDGFSIPAAAHSYDFVTIVDVLHHATDPMALLREAMRVARQAVILKDHNCDSRFARRVMTFTDWFGNRQHGVQLEFNFWSASQWRAAWQELGTAPSPYLTDFGLYPRLTRIVFAKDMDFIARLPVPGAMA